MCSFGDASVNHSTALGAFNSAQWIAHQNYPLPIVFICEDNGWGISVPTPSDWVEQQFSGRKGLHYVQVDGLNLADVYRGARMAEKIAREKQQPVFLHMKCLRLLGHAGIDIETSYRTIEQIQATEANDPLLHSAELVINNGYLNQQQVLEIYHKVKQEVAEMAEKIVDAPRLGSAEEVMASLLPKENQKVLVHEVQETQRQHCFDTAYEHLEKPRNLAQHLNYALTDLMLQYPSIVTFGEDVGAKGGVYRVTADLQKRFGKRRVFDTLLDEQTILGTAIGMGQNGLLPIPEIQFLAYLHNAEDQLRGEAASLSFFSNQQFANPMVVRIASFAYQKGFGGHFHNDNSIAVLRDIPGLVIACPSNGPDGARLLRSCVELALYENRVVVFLEPIALYMAKDLHQVGDNGWLFQYPEPKQRLPFLEVGLHGTGEDLAIISYGNGCYLSLRAQKILQTHYQINARVIDLQWLAPLPIQSLVKALKSCQRILLVDEGRDSGSLSEGLLTRLYQQVTPCPTMRRLVGKNSFISLGDSWRTLLPQVTDIVLAAKEIMKEERK